MTVHERVKDLVARMVLRNNYWGYLFSRIRRAPSENLPAIMGVAPEMDGTITLLYNPKLVDLTTDDVIGKVLEHEGLHLLNKHISRFLRILFDEMNESRMEMKRDLWNIATDCCVNVQGKLPPFLIVAKEPYYLCFPKLYNLPEDKAAEFYYQRLLQNVKHIKIKGVGGKFGNIDDHGGWGKNIEGCPDLSSLSRKLDNYVGNIIKESVKNFNKNRGTIPGYISELIEEALKPPKAPYYQIIRKLVRATKLSKFKRSLAKVNRKRTYVFSINEKESNLPIISPFPGKTRDFSFYVHIILDTSGSMTREEILEGLSGIKNIIENDRHCKVIVFENDTQVNKEYEVKKLRDIQFNISGRGGTILRPALERSKEIGSDVTLCFTDGACDNINIIPRKLLPKKLIWIIGGKNGIVDMVNKTGFVVKI